MIELKRKTYTDQVAVLLERDMRSGKLVAGKRLPSIRKLADEYGVSVQVIQSAFDNLSERGLLLRRSRVGVFVNPEAFIPQSYRLVMVRSRKYNFDYMSDILGIRFGDLYEKTNIYQVMIPYDTHDLKSYLYELNKIKELDPDCVVIGSTNFKTRDIDRIVDIDLPVVFVGDFQDDIPEGDYNMIREDTVQRAEFEVKVAADMGCRKVCMVVANWDYYYIDLLKQGGQAYAKKRGIDFHFKKIELGGGPNKVSTKLWNDFLTQSFVDGLPEALIVEGIGEMHFLVEALTNLGIRLGEDIHVINRLDIMPGITYVKEKYDAFSMKSHDLLKRKLMDRNYHFGKVTLRDHVHRQAMKVLPMG